MNIGVDQVGNQVMPFLSSLLFIISRTSSFHPPFSASELPGRVQSPEQRGAESALYTPPSFRYPDEINWYVTESLPLAV